MALQDEIPAFSYSIALYTCDINQFLTIIDNFLSYDSDNFVLSQPLKVSGSL